MNNVSNNGLGALSDLSINNQRRVEDQDDTIGQDDFLRLMTTQLQAQDPMEPMKTGEIFSQLAEFGTVSGIQDLQDSFSEFAASLQSMQALEASSMVGQKVLVEANSAELNADGQIEGRILTPPGASSVSLTVVDQSGQQVARLAVPVTGSVTEFNWNGLDANGEQVPPGRYKLSAQAQTNGELEGLTVQIRANVDSVTINPGNTGYSLNVNGVGTVQPTDVLEVS